MKFTAEQKKRMKNGETLSIDGVRYSYKTDFEKELDTRHRYICGSWHCIWEGMKDELSTDSEDKITMANISFACPKCGSAYFERPQEYYQELGRPSMTMEPFHSWKLAHKEKLKKAIDRE